MKAAVLFSDSHHTLHLVSVKIPRHSATEGACEHFARKWMKETGDFPSADSWDYVGTLKCHPLQGPVWHVIQDGDETYKGTDK